MKNILLLIALTFFAPVFLQAQGPGYQGKHFTFKVMLSPRIAWNQVFEERSEDGTTLGALGFVKTRLSLEADYVISHNKAVGLVLTPPNGRYYLDNGGFNGIETFRKVKDSSIGLSIKFFDNYYAKPL